MIEQKEISEPKELVLLNPVGGEVILKKLSPSSRKKKKFKEVFASEASMIAGNLVQGTLQVANQSLTVSQIAKQFPNGLFTATVNPSKLSQFKNGTFTTMVHGGANKLSHAGFAEATISNVVNPAMVLSAGMQVMSMVSGTYYLNQINSQISKIDDKLDELLNFHHDENIGKLKAARKGLSEIAIREFVDMVDINSIRNYKKTVEEILEEYPYRLNRQVNEFTPEKKGDDKKLESMNFQISIAFEASKLSLFAELIEIGTRMKSGGQNELIESLTIQLENNYKNSLYFNIDNEVGKYYATVQEKYQDENDSKQKNNKKIEQFVNYVPTWGWGVLGKVAAQGAVKFKKNIDTSTSNKKEEKRQESLNSVMSEAHQNKEIETIDETIAEMIKIPYRESEILYVMDSERQHVYVPID